MTDRDHQHPSDETIARLSAGKLSGGELLELEQHLDGCSACRNLLAVVSNGSAPGAPLERAALSPGEKLGRYEIERLMGAGGMGMLYVARDPQLGRRVALKLMRPAFAGEAGKVRLLREAQAMAQLSHPNVVHVYDIGELHGRVFIAMELVEGGTLRDWIKQPHGWKEVVAMFVAAGEGLWAAHQSGVVHRDFKPENVMLGKDGRPRVGDFGLARPELVAEEELPKDAPMKVTLTGTMLGTPAYMSPEQLQGKPADEKSDQYGFCVALYEALVGKRPFPADSLEQLRALVVGGMPPPPKDGPVPAHVWAAIARGLHPDPSRRFDDLQSLLTVLKVQSSGGATAARGSRLRVAAASLALAAVSAGAAALALRSHAPEPPAPALSADAHPTVPLPPTPPTPASPTPAEPQVPEEPKLANRVLPTEVELALGTQKLFKVPGLSRIAVGDPSIADIKTIGADQLLVVGEGLGHTTLIAWFGARLDQMEVTVAPDAKADPSEPALTIPPGDQKVLVVPNIQRVAIGDSDVADVKTAGNDQLLLVGMHEGRTTLLVWSADGKRRSYLIIVPPPTPVRNTRFVTLHPAQTYGLPQSIAEASTPDSKVVHVSGGPGQLVLTAARAGRATVKAKTQLGATTYYSVEVAGRSADELLASARDLLEQKDFEGAEQELLDCVGAEPKNAECAKLLGSTFARLSQPKESVRWYRRYLELAPAGDPGRSKVQQLLEAVGR